jgi:hypothetical protein
MSRIRLTLTPAIQQAIVAFVRAGGFPHVAAEAAGVPREVFDDWMTRRGRPYRDFAWAVRQAHAQARLRGEVTVHEERPLDWLKSGPGRPAPDSPGWTLPARPVGLTDEHLSPLVKREIQELVTLLLGVIDDPDLRAELSAKLQPFGAQ